jgi:hypothetical protein
MSVSTITLKILCGPSILQKVLVLQSKVLIKYYQLLLLTMVLMTLLIKYPLLLLMKVLLLELLI